MKFTCTYCSKVHLGKDIVSSQLLLVSITQGESRNNKITKRSNLKFLKAKCVAPYMYVASSAGNSGRFFEQPKRDRRAQGLERAAERERSWTMSMFGFLLIWAAHVICHVTRVERARFCLSLKKWRMQLTVSRYQKSTLPVLSSSRINVFYVM